MLDNLYVVFLKNWCNSSLHSWGTRELTMKINCCYRDNNEIKYFAYHKEMKLSFHWRSAVPKNYQKNVIIGNLHCVKNLSSNFEQEVRIIRNKYIKAGYPFHFINFVIDSFIQRKSYYASQLIWEKKIS